MTRPTHGHKAAVYAYPYLGRARGLQLDDFPWETVPHTPLSSEARRCLRYMRVVERHTIHYLHDLLNTRASADDEVVSFLACWVYEETGHGLALERFLLAVGEDVPPPADERSVVSSRLEAFAMALASRVWADFVAVHMTWGAINELCALSAYKRLARLSGHPLLAELLSRIARDEARHFAFYFAQAEQRLRRPMAARMARWLVERFWAPVGSGVQSAGETRFVAGYLFADADGRRTARRGDAIIRRLPGFENARLLEAWVDAHTSRGAPSAHARESAQWRVAPPRAERAG